VANIAEEALDGIFTSYLWDAQNVGLFDYDTQRVTWVTAFPDIKEAQAESLVVSPDGLRVAYSVARRAEGVTEVYVSTLGKSTRRV
jgi:hypothetical protein